MSLLIQIILVFPTLLKYEFYYVTVNNYPLIWRLKYENDKLFPPPTTPKFDPSLGYFNVTTIVLTYSLYSIK